MTLHKDFLSEAEALLATVNSSISRQRTIVGRSYYAAYHAVFSIATMLGYVRDNRDSRGRSVGNHADLIDWLATQRNKNIVNLGRDLQALKQLRTTADYDNPPWTLAAQDARECVKKAKSIVEKLCEEIRDEMSLPA